MELIEAVVAILKEAGKPLSVVEIVKMGLGKKFFNEGDNNLNETIDSAILKDIKTKGIHSNFTRIGPGVYFVRNFQKETNFNTNFNKKREKHNRWRNQGFVEKSNRKEEKTERNFKETQKRENKNFLSDVKNSVKVDDVRKAAENIKSEISEKNVESNVGDKSGTAKSIENIGEYMKFDVSYLEKEVILWKKFNNPEIAFIVDPEFSSALMGKIVELRNYNFRKIVLVFNENKISDPERFFPNEEIKTWCEIWSDKLIKDMEYHLEKFMDIFVKLVDFRDISQKGVYFFK